MKKLQLTSYYANDPKWYQNLWKEADYEFEKVNAILRRYNAEYVCKLKEDTTLIDYYISYDKEEELLMCMLKYS